MVCEELVIPFSALLLETTPPDSTHCETHTPPKSPFQASAGSNTHSTPEYPSSPLQTEALADPLANSPSHVLTPAVTPQKISEDIQQGEWKQSYVKRNEQLTGPLPDASIVELANPFDNNLSPSEDSHYSDSEDILRQGQEKKTHAIEQPASLPLIDVPIEELASPFANSPSDLSTPEETHYNDTEDIQQGQEKQRQVEKSVKQLASLLPDGEVDPLANSPSHLSTHEETTHNNSEDFQTGQEKMKQREKGIEQPASLPVAEAENAPIEELTSPSTNSPSHLSTPEGIDQINSEEDLQKQVENGLEGIKQLDNHSINGSSHIRVGTIPDSNEKGHDEVDLGPGYSEQEVEVEETDHSESERLYKPTSRDGVTSPPLPPEDPVVEQRMSGKTSLTSPTHKFGKKRLRTQSMECDEIEEERESTREGERQRRKIRQSTDEERLFVAILSYDPEAMCSTGRPEKELLLHEGQYQTT